MHRWWRFIILISIIPKFNKLDKQGDKLNIQVDEKEWKVYQVIKKPNTKYEAENGILTWIMLAALAGAVIQFLLRW